MQPKNVKVWVITMTFPEPSEIFACNDIFALKKIGLEVSVHGLRFRHKLFSNLIFEKGLQGIWITHNSIKNSLNGLLIALKEPFLFANFIWWISKHSWKKPVNLLKSLILIPRSLQIFNDARSQHPNIVYLYWSHFPALVGYLIQSQLPDIIVSISFVAHDVYYSEFNTKNSYSGFVAHKADLIQSITAANIPEIEKHGISKEKILLFYHGVDFNKIPRRKEKIQRRIVTAGRLISDKGFDLVLQIFSQILLKWPDASLIILGDGPERKKLESLASSLNISDAVHFRGFVSHTEVFEEMLAAEIFLFMSKAERIPNVIKEAIASYCLCITSYTPGIEELINDQVHGYIVKQGDVEAAVKKIQKSFENPEEMNYMTDTAYQYLKDNFDLDYIIKNIWDIWANLVTSKMSSSLVKNEENLVEHIDFNDTKPNLNIK